jgi:hypothetical protein
MMESSSTLARKERMTNATLNLCLGDIEQGISKRTVSKMRAIDCLTEEGRAFGKWGWKENSSHE